MPAGRGSARRRLCRARHATQESNMHQPQAQHNIVSTRNKSSAASSMNAVPAQANVPSVGCAKQCHSMKFPVHISSRQVAATWLERADTAFSIAVGACSRTP
eukprot:6992217-Prymnesium_polylepis.2